MITNKINGEQRTILEIIGGKSIARYGDGEIRIMEGSGCVSQVKDRRLTEELRNVIRTKDANCLIGIPTFDQAGPKFGNWKKYIPRIKPFLRDGKIYHSAFISRPDSAPWIAVPEYFDLVESLWSGREIALVHCRERSPIGVMQSAARIHEIVCPRRDAYAEIDYLEKQIIDSGCIRVILCAGAAATCLAYRLSQRGIHAIDLGHTGTFWRCYNWPHWEFKYHEKN